MASSRNKNTPGNYVFEMNEHNRFRNHILYKGSVSNDAVYYPGDGLLGCRNPDLALLNNYTDIETSLFGIGSTNLVNPKSDDEVFVFHPFKIIDIQERNKVILPQPLVVNKHNRPDFN